MPKLYTLRVRYPGSIPEIAAEPIRVQLMTDFWLLEGELTKAVTALNFREMAFERASVLSTAEEHEARENRTRAIMEPAIRSAMDSAGGMAQLYADAKRQVALEEWSQARISSHLWSRLGHLLTQEAVFALHTFRELVGCIGSDVNKWTKSSPELISLRGELASVRKAINDEYAHLSSVRDSLHHLENRARGRDKQNREIPPNMPGEGRQLVIGSQDMNGGYSVTLADGSIGRVPVSAHTLDRFGELFERILYAVQWDGPATIRDLP